MIFKVTGIDWDCEDCYGLPYDTEIEADDENDVVDELSNKYGFCVNSIEDIQPM